MQKKQLEKVETILLEMRKSGYRKSKSREGILRILVMSKNPLSVSEIRDVLKKKDIFFNKTTVYREMALLIRLGYVKELRLRGDTVVYEMDMSHHHHLVCTDCGVVRHINLGDSLYREEVRIAKKEKFVIREHVLEFFGVCEECQ